jgi:hypothetical protein
MSWSCGSGRKSPSAACSADGRSRKGAESISIRFGAFTLTVACQERVRSISADRKAIGVAVKLLAQQVSIDIHLFETNHLDQERPLSSRKTRSQAPFICFSLPMSPKRIPGASNPTPFHAASWMFLSNYHLVLPPTPHPPCWTSL